MLQISKKLISYLIENDCDHEYQKAINKLSVDYGFLFEHTKKIASNDRIDGNVFDAAKIIMQAVDEVEKTSKMLTAAVKKEDDETKLDFYTNAVLKTLKTAQMMLASLLFKSPFKIGIAYNALHFIIRYIEREMKKKAKEKAKKEQKQQGHRKF